MEALRSEAAKLGLASSKLILEEKGPIFTGMNTSQFSALTEYKEVVVLGAENSDVRLNEWCYAERASLWLTGAFSEWSGNPIGDHIATNRISEWSAMRNAHMVLRQLLSTFAMGATWFRSDVSIPRDNPLFLRGDTTDPDLALANPYRQGVVPFLRMVEAGVFPAAPRPAQLHGVSPVAIAIPEADPRFGLHQAVNHDWNKYKPQPQQFAVNSLECWHAYTRVPDYDITAIAHGSTRRWDSLFPTSPSGFVPICPFSSRASLESSRYFNRSFETDVNRWAEFGSDLGRARDEIGAELVRQRANALLVVEPDAGVDAESGRCFWQLTAPASQEQDGVYFLLLMDPAALDPKERRIALRLGHAAPAGAAYHVFDQLVQRGGLVGTLRGGDAVPITVAAGSVRLLTLRAIPSTTGGE